MVFVTSSISRDSVIVCRKEYYDQSVQETLESVSVEILAIKESTLNEKMAAVLITGDDNTENEIVIGQEILSLHVRNFDNVNYHLQGIRCIRNPDKDIYETFFQASELGK